MRLRDRLPTKWGTLADDLTHVAGEQASRARGWTDQLGIRFTRSTATTTDVYWVHETPLERGVEATWRSEVGLSGPHTVQSSAPLDFTSSVMARIAAQQAPKVAPTVHFKAGGVEPVRMVAGTVCISAMVALTSSCFLAILAPTQALALLGWLVDIGTLLLLVIRGCLGIVTSLLTSSVVLIALTSIGPLALIMLLRLRQGQDQLVHES